MNKSLIGIGLIIIAVVIGIVLIRPKISDIRTVSIERAARLKVVQAKEQRRNGLKTLVPVFAGDKAKINTYLSTLPKEPEIPEVLVTLETMTRDNSVSLESITPQTDARKQVVSVAMTGEGELASIERLMQAIADNNRPLSVTSISLSRKQDSNILTYSLTVTFPYVPATPLVNPSAAPATEQGV